MVYPSERFLYDSDFVVSSGYYIFTLEATTLSQYFFSNNPCRKQAEDRGCRTDSAAKSSRILGFRGMPGAIFGHALWSKPDRRIAILEFFDILESI